MTYEETLIPVPGGDGPVCWERRHGKDARAVPARPPAVEHGIGRAALVVDNRSDTCVYNRARTGEPAYRVARDLLAAAGVPLQSAYALRDPTRLPETVRGALSEGHDLIILGGGDGSVSSVADLLARSGAVLGLLPLGFTNGFARALGIPLDLEGACETIARGGVVPASLGLAGDEYFANAATLAPGAARASLDQEPFCAALDFPGGDHDPVVLDGLVRVALGTGRSHNATGTAFGAGGKTLDVYAVQTGRGVGLGRSVPGLGGCEFARDGRVHHWRTSRARVETHPRIPIELDGERVARTPKTFSVARKALKVLAPTLPVPVRRNGARTRTRTRRVRPVTGVEDPEAAKNTSRYVYTD